MDRKQLIDHYLQRLTEKGFEIYDVRRELEKKNVEEEEIKIIVRAVDDELQARLLKSASADYAGVPRLWWEEMNASYFTADGKFASPSSTSAQAQYT